MLLIVRPSLLLYSTGTGVLKQLEKYLQEKKETSEWPGTRLLNETALVFQYAFEPASATILQNATDALYSWRQPNLPEDLCFLRGNGEPWLVSIAHERDSYCCLTEDEKSRLQAKLPELGPLVQDESS